ncbi:lactadherin-like [Stylophora pistillata]|uniref:lactadherin-like n=1 Tax=Stylophora pistillata TaxID=50429 RepID=UPI000C0430F7|nr:lactadherin-like [Stylophora pistillata]
MKPLLRSEDFDPGRQIQVSSEHYLFGDRRRVVNESVPWCVKDKTLKEWVQVDLGCSSPLGMGSRKIRDNQIKVSSVKKGELNAKASNGRLNTVGGWCVEKLENYEYTRSNKKHKSFLPKEFLEVDLLSEKFIDGFATQGHSSRGLGRFVTGYLVHYSVDGFSWDVITWEERERYFIANRNSRDTKRQYLNPRIRARYIRFVPVTWYNYICMRVEIYGCDAGESLQDKLEKKILDVQSERVEYVRMETGINKNKHREPINYYYKTAIFKCGKPPDDGIPWRNNRYLL